MDKISANIFDVIEYHEPNIIFIEEPKILDPEMVGVRMNQKEIRTTVLQNIVKMIGRRKWIGKKGEPIIIKDVLEKMTRIGEDIYILDLDIDLNREYSYAYNYEKKEMTEFPDGFIPNKMAILIYQNVMRGLTKSKLFTNFLDTYKYMHKYIVVEDISNEYRQTIVTNSQYPYTEIFMEKNLMIDLGSHVLCPQYQVLTQEECDLVKEEYKLRNSELRKVFNTGPESLYFKFSRKQIIRVFTKSAQSGVSVSYIIITSATTSKTDET